MSQNHATTQAKTQAKIAARRLPPSLTLLNVQVARGHGAERLFQQIREAIRATIVSGEIAGRLPPTREMAAALA